MTKWLSFYGLVGLASLCLFFLLLNQHYNGYFERRLQPALSVAKNAEVYAKGSVDDFALGEIQRVVERQKRSVEAEMRDYDFPNGRYGANVSKLEDLLLERGGRPMRSLIVTSWRSGSTFLGDVVSAHPANFYHYEPLLNFGIVQVRGPPHAEQALRNVRSLLNCDYKNMDRYLNFGKTHVWLFSHNALLWKQCQAHRRICWDPEFLSRFCRLFPFQSMKTVRLRLRVAEQLLAETSLGARLALLVRDPRGILQSRKHRSWCTGKQPDCSDPAVLCADMVSDFNVATRLIKKYPQTFRVLRYEELSVEPYKYSRELYKFYGLNFHANAKRFLDTHTKNDAGDLWSTFRNSKAAPFHWQTDLTFEQVDEIQRTCAAAMQHWGYVLATNATHQKYFHPITEYRLEL